MLIAGYDAEVPIGYQFRGALNSETQEMQDQPFVVIGLSTYDEWLAWTRGFRGREPTPAQKHSMRQKAFFYKLSTD